MLDAYSGPIQPSNSDTEVPLLRKIAALLFGGFSSGDNSKLSVDMQSGKNGGALLSDTATHNGNFTVIQVLSDTVFTTATGNVTGLVGPTIPEGTYIYGVFTALKLASGSVIAYNA